jgi:hypothetical protein
MRYMISDAISSDRVFGVTISDANSSEGAGSAVKLFVSNDEFDAVKAVEPLAILREMMRIMSRMEVGGVLSGICQLRVDKRCNAGESEGVCP